MAQRAVGWGILSSARIGRSALIPAITAASNARLVCLGTPHPERVQESAAEYGYPVLTSYQAVLENPEVEAVYNPLPNGMHASWSIRALQAGKHVLCEKPFSVTAEEAREMSAVAGKGGRRLMEAFMYRFHPQMNRALEVLRSGRLGELRLIRASFTFNLPPNPANPRWQREQGPGALLDVGCYCISAVRFFSGGAPAAVFARSTWEAASGGDSTTVGILEYQSHSGLFDCSLEAAGRSSIELVGSRGRLEISRPWLPGKEPAVIRVWEGGSMEELMTEGVDHYRLMVEHFSDCLLRNRPPRFGPEDAVENMRVLEAIRRSAREQRGVSLSEV